MPPKKDKTKQKQKQSQSQNVVVNVAYHNKKRGPSKRQAQSSTNNNNSKPTLLQPQPQQQLYQAIPYLGLQSANNAQLLNSIQTSLAALYSQNNKQLTSVPPTNGFQAPRLLPQAPPQSTVVHVHPAQTPVPAPPVVNVHTPAQPAPVVNVQTPAPTVNVQTPAPTVNVHTPAPARASSTRRTSLANAPADARQPMNRTAPDTTPIVPPLSKIMEPSTPQADLIPAGEPAQRRRSVEFEDHNPRGQLPPPEALVQLLINEHGLKQNKTGLVNKKSKEWNRLPQEIKDRILSLEPTRAVKAKPVPDNEDAVMIDDANVQLMTKRKKAPIDLEVDEDAEMEEYLDKSYKSSSIPNVFTKMMDSHKIHGHTEMKPQSQFQQKSFLGLRGPSNKVVPTAYDTDTDYGNDITSDIDGPP